METLFERGFELPHFSTHNCGHIFAMYGINISYILLNIIELSFDSIRVKRHGLSLSGYILIHLYNDIGL